jgi:hypothetical protein
VPRQATGCPAGAGDLHIAAVPGGQHEPLR